MPCDTFITSTYLVLWGQRVGIWLCSFYTHLVKYGLLHLLRAMADTELVDVWSQGYDTGSSPMGGRRPGMWLLCLQTRNVSIGFILRSYN